MHNWLFKDKDTASSRAGHHTQNESGRRLVRCQNIRGLRYSDDDVSNDASRSSLRETVSRSRSPSWSGRRLVRCQNIWGLRYSDDDLSNDASRSSLWETVSHSRSPSWDGYFDGSTSGYSTDSASSDDAFKSSASHGISSAITRDLQSLLGMHAGVAGLQRSDQGYGGGLHIHTHFGKSAPNNTLTSPVTSPKTWGSEDSQWLRSYASNNLTSLGSSYDNLTWTGAPTHSTIPGSPPTSLLSPRSFSVSPCGSSKPESGPPVCKWQKGCLLGSGACARVYKGIHSKTGELCAIKEVEYVEDDPKSQESAKQLEQEIMLLNSFRHPNIVHYKGSEMVDGCLKIYLELVLGGSIHKLCQEFKKLEEPVIRRYTRQILHGLHYLHSENIVHRDIKGANILVDQEGTVKLADFGVAKQIKKQGGSLSFKGSPYWMAPEVIMQENTRFECAIDIWSLGCTVMEMVTGKPPWSEYERHAAMCKVSKAEIPPVPQGFSSEGQSFIKLCLQRNPADRPSAEALLQHPFVQISNDGPDLTMQAINTPDF